MKKIPTRAVSPAQKKKLIEALVRAPNYSRAYQDLSFLGREELRPVRLQLELLKPELALTEQDVCSTIIVFGSARVPAPEEARKLLADAERAARARPRERAAQLALESARRVVERSRYYEEARRFGYLATRAGQADKAHHFVVVTGGGPGIMEAANRGAFDARGKSIGLNITLPHEQAPNPYVTPQLNFQFHYFAIRKMHFLMRARAMVAFPGGFGTFDELFETLTLVQTGKKRRMPIILFGREFWTRAVNFNTLVSEGMIAAADLSLVRYVETAEEAWEHIRGYWAKNGGGPEVRRRRSLSEVIR
ncbi:MAG TPA: TIGR00730 family Rossman fold protein [Elusimicrobiota bacterium]|nr:TIGR00730 family Rossman fold protein [Elusimicrobiota bacterium]